MSCSPKFFSQESSSSHAEEESSHKHAKASLEDIISSFRKEGDDNDINNLGENTPYSLDMEALLKSPCLPFLVDMLPPALIYNSLEIEGISNCLRLVGHIKGQTLVKIMDYALWSFDKNLQTSDINTDNFLEWLDVWLALGGAFAFDRILELGEETVVSIISKLYDIKVVGVSKIDENIEENWYLTEDKCFYLQIPKDFESKAELLTRLIKELYAIDGKKVKAILSYSSMLIRAESLEEALKWRDIRLQEQGILSHLDALSLLKKHDENYFLHTIKEKIKAYKDHNAQESPDNILNHNESLESEKKEESQKRILKYFQDLESKDALQSLNAILKDSKSLLPWQGDSKISNPDVFIDDSYLIDVSKSVFSQAQKTLNAILFHQQQRGDKTTNREVLLFEELIRELSKSDPEKALLLKSSLCQLTNNFLSSMNQSLQNLNLHYYLSVVKGFLNLGLETVLEKSSLFGLDVLFKDEKITGSSLLKAKLILDVLGVDVLFKLAWNVLQNLMLKFLRKVDFIISSLETIKIKNHDSHLSFEVLYFKRNFLTINKNLMLLKEYVSNESFVLMDKLIRKVPLFPSYILEKSGLKISQSYDFFSNVEDIKNLERLIHEIDKSFFEI